VLAWIRAVERADAAAGLFRASLVVEALAGAGLALAWR
jgi:hypothetical protein